MTMANAGSKCGLCDIGGGVERAGTGCGLHRNAELAPEALRIQRDTLECVPEHPVEKDDLARPA